MSDQNKPIILVDGSSYLYRAFHALPALTNSKGFPTGAVYGMISMLKKLITDYQPTYMAVVFDTKGKTFRDELYQDYKATRDEMPSALAQQIEPIHHIIRALGIPILAIEGVEADDVIGTLALHAMNDNMPTLVSTSDKDLAQLVNDKVTLMNTMSNVKLDPAGVKEKFGVTPEHIIDYLTLIGDTSDNIPGVPQVGPKTAAKWLQQYGSLEALVSHADQISGKVGENFRAFLPQLPLTKSLVTIKTDVPLPVDFSDLTTKPADYNELINLYKEMEFKNWLAELLTMKPEGISESQPVYEIITSLKDYEHWIKQLAQAEIISFDVQTTSFDPMVAHLVGIAFSFAAGKAVYVPFGHDYLGVPMQLTREEVLSRIKPILENALIQKIGNNLKAAIEVLANENICLQGIAFDTMLESYVLESISNSHDTDSLSLKFLGTRTTRLDDIAGKGAKQLPFNQVSLEQAGQYAAARSAINFKLHQHLWPRVIAEPGLNYIFEKIEMPLVSVLATMERIGVLIDSQKLAQQGKELKKRLFELEQEAYALAQGEFNLNSPKQLQEILFQQLKLPVLQKTPTGQPSTADPVLQELAMDFALPRLIIESRSLSKLISTYTNRLVDQINPRTGRVHTFYNQSSTSTGRLSSSEPNLQNIPIRTPEGRRIRQAFIASPGFSMISADYSQIELRIMAHISEDPGLLYAFAHNLDIHTATAAEVWEVPLEKVTSEMRSNAKAINFGLIYGMSAFGLTRQLGIDRKSAEDYIHRYFARYPLVKAYMDKTRAHAKETGYVETLWGRRLYVPDINASQIPRQRAAERAAINAPLQGSAADIIKIAMIRIDSWIRANHINAKMIMQVHDELVFEAATDEVEAIALAVREHMSKAVSLRVPLLVSVGTGDNWDAASAH